MYPYYVQFPLKYLRKNINDFRIVCTINQALSSKYSVHTTKSLRDSL